MRFHRYITASVLLVAVVALAACGSSKKSSSSTTAATPAAPATSTAAAAPAGKPGAGKPKVTIGDKNFPEENILGELYGQALTAQGFDVTVKANIGSSEITDKALTSGKIDMYPEYTGTILSELAHQTKRPSSADDAYTAAKKFEEGRGFTLLDKTPFFDSDAIAVKASTASSKGLTSVADLKKLGSFKLAAFPEFKTRYEGLVGLKKVYGVTPTFKPLSSSGLIYKALSSGEVDAADVFTTDGPLKGGKYTLLKDPQFIFGFQNVAPVVSQKVLTAEGPAFAATLNKVSALLTTQAVQSMNAAVSLNQQQPKAVATQFLKANGLI